MAIYQMDLMEIIAFWDIRNMTTFVLACVFLMGIFLALFLSRMSKAKHVMSSESPKIIPSPEQWGAKTNQKFILLDLNLPFTPDVHDVIYVENEYDPVVNQYIQEHFKELHLMFHSNDLSFNYTPKMRCQDISKETLHYMFPYLSQDFQYVNDDANVNSIGSHILTGKIAGPALIHYLYDEEKQQENYYFSYCPLVPQSEVSLHDQFKWYIGAVCRTRIEGPRYMLVLPEGDEVADACFNDGDADSSFSYAAYMDADDLKLVLEIRERIHKLRIKGYQLGQLNNLIEEQPTLSRLVITKDFRIILPDYNNMEIIMPPLPKAVYLLFLKHPEGIPFKQLRNYYDELLGIYKQISNRVIELNIKSSIRDITDPTKNSINEKCTRILEAFLKQFDFVYAQHYFITGKRGESKKITLPRELVDLQAL